MSSSKYLSLGEYLLTCKKDSISLSFVELEEILGFPLPNSARKFRTWWSNNRTHLHAETGWLSFGWRVSNINLETRSVQFNRMEKLRLYQPSTATKEANLKIALPTIGKVRRFELKAREVLSKHFQMKLRPKVVQPVNRLFDYVSIDKKFVGDSKYFSLSGKRIQSTRLSAISENVWFLEKTNAERRFLVFGNTRAVPEVWLTRHGNLIQDVEFYFLDDKNQLERIH